MLSEITELASHVSDSGLSNLPFGSFAIILLMLIHSLQLLEVEASRHFAPGGAMILDFPVIISVTFVLELLLLY